MKINNNGHSVSISLKTKTLDSWALVVQQNVDAQAGGVRVYLPLLVR